MKNSLLIFFIVACILLAGCTSPTTTSPPTITPTTLPALSPTISLTTPPTLSTEPEKGELEIHFIDVGQGDSELILGPSGKVMLIDAGPSNAGSKVVTYLHNQGVNTIDILLATHPHEDHIGGMVAVLNGFHVEQFFDSGYPHTTSVYENMLNLIDQKNISFRTVKSGDVITFDPAIELQVLNPQATFSTDINQNSIVLKMTYGKISYLFTGDAGGDAENKYASTPGHIDILKVAHHGSSTSSGLYFLSQVTPALSIIEVGARNSYGHPAQATLQRLQQAGSKIYRTDLDGTITVTSNGNTYSVTTEKQGTLPAIIVTAPVPVITHQTTTVPTTVTTSGGGAVCDCSYNRYNCADFKTHAAAQACYNYCIVQGRGDIHRLDADKDGNVCEDLP